MERSSSGTVTGTGKDDSPSPSSARSARSPRPSDRKRRAGGRQVALRKYRHSRKARQKLDFIPANANGRLASRYYRLKTGHHLTGQHLEWARNQPTARCCGATTRRRRGSTIQELPPVKTPAEILWAEVRRETGRGKDRFGIPGRFVDERWSQAVLDFLSTTDVGR